MNPLANLFAVLAGAATLSSASPAYAQYWPGCYLGGNFGGMSSSSGATVGFGNAATGAPANFGGALAAGAFDPGYSDDDLGVLGGLHAGCNLQSNKIVFGLEVDFQGVALNLKETSLTTNIPGFADQEGRYSADLDWFGTLRLRLGTTLTPSLLGYLTGGVAVGGVQQNYSLIVYQPTIGTPPAGTNSGSLSSTEFGWIGGGGLEQKFGDGMTFGVEYLYLWFDGDSFQTANPTGTCVTNNDCHFNVNNDDIDNHIVRLKVNFKLGTK